MDIGEQQRVIIVEPLTMPEEFPDIEPDRVPDEAPEPVRTGARGDLTLDAVVRVLRL